MPYTALLGLHLLVVAVFIGGLLIVALALPGFGREASDDQIPMTQKWPFTPRNLAP